MISCPWIAVHAGHQVSPLQLETSQGALREHLAKQQPTTHADVILTNTAAQALTEAC